MPEHHEEQQRGEGDASRAWEKFGKHYIRDIVYAAHDGIITTFAVIAAAHGADLGAVVVLVLGFANLAADGLAMGIGNYLGIKSERAVHLQDGFQHWEETLHAARHGGVTWASFAVAGFLPLIPFLTGRSLEQAFLASIVATALALFTVGALRTRITGQPTWLNGLEMLGVGALAGGVAYFIGQLVGRLIGTV